MLLKKNVYICLPFKGDIVSTQIKHRLGVAIGKTYYAANLIITYDTKRLLKESNVDKNLFMSPPTVFINFHVYAVART